MGTRSLSRAAADRLALRYRGEQQLSDQRRVFAWRGMSVELVEFHGARELAYELVGTSHYLALHDLQLTDGEIRADGTGFPRQLDLRQRLTFAPVGCRLEGWSAFCDRRNSYLALFFDPDILREEREIGLAGDGSPMVHFEDPELAATLAKLQSLLRQEEPADALYAETLGLVAALEIERRCRLGSPRAAPASGRLSVRQARLIEGYIDARLASKIALAELAELAQLSRFHFTRAFKKTFGLPPHQFVLHRRAERAKGLLQAGELPIREIAVSVGFGSQSQFADAFRKITGHSPRQWRRLTG